MRPPIELKTGRFGPYLACVKYKDTCDYVKSLKKARAPDRPTDEKCHLCGSPMVIKTGRFGEFLACTTYPGVQGHRADPARDQVPQVPARATSPSGATKRGKSFWGCVRYPACDFSTWNKPVPETCPECGWVGMEKKMSKAEGETRTCLQCEQQDRPRRARGGGDWRERRATVVGGGLAGSEAAWALAERGVRVTLYEMRPVVATPAHQTDRLAELVCSNSFKSVELGNAHGLLKAELRAAREPAARRAPTRRGCRAAPRWRWTARSSRDAVHEPRRRRIPNITVVRGEVDRRCPSPGVVATGPLTSEALGRGDRRAARHRRRSRSTTRSRRS